MKLKILSNSSEKTRLTGERFASLLSPGDIIFLLGELGGGKTTFISGIAKGLEARGNVSSPSFTLINIYDFAIEGIEYSLVHCDLYRISGFKEIPDIGIEEYIYDDRSIVFIEWGDFLKEKISKDHLVIKFEYLFDDENQKDHKEISYQKRQLIFSSENAYWNQKLKLFKEMNSL